MCRATAKLWCTDLHKLLFFAVAVSELVNRREALKAERVLTLLRPEGAKKRRREALQPGKRYCDGGTRFRCGLVDPDIRLVSKGFFRSFRYTFCNTASENGWQITGKLPASYKQITGELMQDYQQSVRSNKHKSSFLRC